MRPLLIFILSIFVFSFASAGTIGFGMTDIQGEVVMEANTNNVCVTYYIYNPSDTSIEGFLDVTREEGKGLNTFLGLDKLYSDLSILENESAELQTTYNSLLTEGKSTFEIEQEIEKITLKIQSINEEISKKKPKLEKINIPAKTPAKDENGNFQMPVKMCFERPTKKYLFQTIGDTNFCGRYEGEIIGSYTPITDGTGSTGSAIIGSRSTTLKLTVKCSGVERRIALIKFIIGIIVIFGIIFFVLWKLFKKRKPKETQEYQEQIETNK